MRSAAHPDFAAAEAVARRFQESFSESGPAWLEGKRTAAREWFVKTGFPTVRQEGWRQTNIEPITALDLCPARAEDWSEAVRRVRSLPFERMDCYRLVFVDGIFVPSLSSLPGKEWVAGSLREGILAGDAEAERGFGKQVSHEASAFAALNAAFFRDGALIRVPAGIKVEKPAHLVFINSGSVAGTTVFPRNLILVGEGASMTVVESYTSLSDAPVLTCAVTEVALGAGATVEHCKTQDESAEAFHVASAHATQAAGSRWFAHSISSGGRLSRNELRSALDGEGAECLFNGLYMARGNQLIDNETAVDHLKPRCESHEYYHGILDGHAHGVFNGKIFVRQDAQKTNARQTNRNLLLSEDAVIDTKPELEIYADDVKCSHGATVGRLDEEQLFYLRARGIGLEAARRMLIRAFASEVIARIPAEVVRKDLEENLEKQFAQNE
jgi:Fe-S cluster assembly protein SufD